MINLIQIRKHPELKKHLEQAYDEILLNEADLAAIKLRKALEYVVKMYVKECHCNIKKGDVLDDMIVNLKDKVRSGQIAKSVLDNNDIQMFFDVKNIGNSGAHDSTVSLRKVEERYQDFEEFLPKFLNAFGQD